MGHFPIEAYRQGMLEERERIIAVLEDYGERNYVSQQTVDEVMPIIKEETDERQSN